jgi:CRP-like cAMP-binding protein
MEFFDDFGLDDTEDRLSDVWPSEETTSQIQPRFSVPYTRCFSSTALQTVENTEAIVQYRRREPLTVHQGQLWEIRQGFIKALTWDEQGCVLTLGIWGPGESVGLPLGNIDPYQLLCVTAVQVKSIQLKEGYPYEFLWNQAQQTQELLNLFRCRSMENRLLDLLWWLASRFGKALPGGYCTGIPLTHQELADIIGSTRVTTTRMLRQLEEAGKLERPDDRQLLLKEQPRCLGMRKLRF